MENPNLVPLVGGWRDIARERQPLVDAFDLDRAHAFAHAVSPFVAGNAESAAITSLTHIAIIAAEHFAAGRNN